MKIYLKLFLMSFFLGVLLGGCGESDDENNLSPVTQIAKITASDPQERDYFGNSIAMNDDYIVVGAKWEDSTADEAGSVYVFRKYSDTNITQIAKIQADDADSYKIFGTSVSISGNYIVVGTSYHYDEGGAYLFKIDSSDHVTQIAKLQTSDETRFSNFGISVAISGNYIVVGADEDDSAAMFAGSAYVFKINSDTNVTQIAKIYSDDIQHGDNFGNSVSIDGEYIVVGAHYEDTTVSYAGSAYLFKINSDTNITQVAKIHADDADVHDRFGNSVSISGDYIVVGASSGDLLSEKEGSAYLFKRNSDTNVTQITKLQASNIQNAAHFGNSVSISGEYIVVGANHEEEGVGAAYLYKINSDTDVSQVIKIQHSDGVLLGSSVAIDGNYITIGSLNESNGAYFAGSVYLYKK